MVYTGMGYRCEAETFLIQPTMRFVGPGLFMFLLENMSVMLETRGMKAPYGKAWTIPRIRQFESSGRMVLSCDLAKAAAAPLPT
ncbi:hypothetical protein D3871_27940 [Noviherbaspirillum saxi]|uniref:Uncharacterized protein n=1 Tax=Noviherbaspirillum saxi TaxID=2320863 RepID=A0A3A3FZD5_9BURK|nr:hypothetical protein D3871_27940 [Noviherbaspirillum saxi]